MSEKNQYYVGIGASAGGLEALESFFRNMPNDSNLVFIVIQHLSPDYKSLMNELLARYTSMEINIAEDGMKTEANKIYLIPPRMNLSIFHGQLFLEKQEIHHHRLSLPIDIFFRSLAADQGKKAIGVILSGTGSDGTLGVRAIKEAGGMVMVQEESSAKFDGMPRSSIATGLVDYILKPQSMSEELMNYIRHPSIDDSIGSKNSDAEEVDDITKICLILRSFGSVDFSHYKNNTLIRRIDRRIKINRLDTVEAYIGFLRESDKEKEILQRELLIGVTAFFRDKEAFESLEKNVLPNLDYSKKTIRIWSAACSTGEEVYSLAILLFEFLDQHNHQSEIKIFATDVDTRSLEIAGNGFYPDSIVADVDSERLSKYFVKKEEGYQITDRIRKSIVFARHNVLKDPPFSKLDLLVCRNFFIYLKSDVQQQVLSSFYYSINPSGFLFMGNSESIGDMSAAYETVDSKWKIFKCKEGYRAPIQKNYVYSQEITGRSYRQDYDKYGSNHSASYERLLMNVLADSIEPSVIIDSNENIIQVIGDTGKYIHQQMGRFSTNFNSNMSKDLALYVSNIIRRLRLDRKEIIFSNVTLPGDLEESITIKGKLIPNTQTDHYLLSFSAKKQLEPIETIEVDMTEEAKERVKQLQSELQIAREGLQATIEELETSNEELQSSNEELIASNEELQSTNEELQSVNEELYTVNNEHQSKIGELTDLNNDISNLLRNTEVGALYLDKKLCIRRLTPLVTKVTNIMEQDIGRPIFHLSVMESYPMILEDIDQVLDTLKGVERELTNIEGRTYLSRIRPYRSEYNSVDGVIMTLVDITKLKTEQSATVRANQRLSVAMEIGNIAWWEYDLSTGEVIYSDKKATMLGYDPDEFPNNVYEICSLIHPEDYDSTMQAMKDYITGNSSEWNITYRMKRKDNGYSYYHDVGTIVKRNEQGEPLKLIGAVLDISKFKLMEKKLQDLQKDV